MENKRLKKAKYADLGTWGRLSLPSEHTRLKRRLAGAHGWCVHLEEAMSQMDGPRAPEGQGLSAPAVTGGPSYLAHGENSQG